MTLDYVEDFASAWTDPRQAVNSVEAWEWNLAPGVPVPQNTYAASHKGVNFKIVTQEAALGSWTGEAEISYPTARETLTLLTVLSEVEWHMAKLHADEVEAMEASRREAHSWIERELAHKCAA